MSDDLSADRALERMRIERAELEQRRAKLEESLQITLKQLADLEAAERVMLRMLGRAQPEPGPRNVVRHIQRSFEDSLRRRPRLKDVALSLLQAAGDAGMTVTEIADRYEALAGTAPNLASLHETLRRFRHEQRVVYRDGKWISAAALPQETAVASDAGGSLQARLDKLLKDGAAEN